MKRADITPEMLRRLLRYDPETGALYWRVWRGKPQLPGLEPRADSPTLNGYRCVSPFRHTMLSHRVAWAIVHGQWPEGEIDHINRVRDDNRLSNLREVTREENQRNRTGFGNVPVVGICLERDGTFRAQMAERKGGKLRRPLNRRFRTLREAVAARIEAERKHGWPDRGETVDQIVKRAERQMREAQKGKAKR